MCQQVVKARSILMKSFKSEFTGRLTPNLYGSIETGWRSIAGDLKETGQRLLTSYIIHTDIYTRVLLNHTTNEPHMTLDAMNYRYIHTQASHSFTDKKSRTFPGSHEKFSRTFSEPANVKKPAFIHYIQSAVKFRKFR